MDRELIMFLAELAIRGVVLIASFYGWQFIRKHNLQNAVQTAVAAAEMYFRQPGMGAAKKQRVEEYILKRFTITEEELTVLIDAAVNEMNRGKAKTLVLPPQAPQQ